MSFGDIGKSFERLMRCTNNLCETAEPNTKGAGHAYAESFRSANESWQRLEVVMQKATDNAPARAWLSAHLERKLFFRLEMLFITIRENAEVATGSSTNATARLRAVSNVHDAGQTAFMLLSQACFMVNTVLCGRSKSDQDLGQKALSAMAQRSLMKAVAEASRAVAATAASVQAEATTTGFLAEKYPTKQLSESTLGMSPMALYLWKVTCLKTGAICEYASSMAQTLARQLSGARLASGGRTGSTIPQGASQLADSLAESQLLAAAAAAITDSPSAMPVEGELKVIYDGVCSNVHLASLQAAQALAGMATSQQNAQALGGPDGRRLACVLLRATRHVAVRRLQVALLDRLAAHAGMGAELGSGEEGQRQQQRQGDNQPNGWEGSGGAWWLACEEAQRGQLLGLPHGEAGEAARSQTAGWLEEYHNRIVSATLWEWGQAGPQLAEEAGVPAAPPPLLRARLAARAAEALCRLYRGKGLRGAYAPSPEWFYAHTKVQSLRLVLKRQTGLCQSAAHACMPYRLETAGWTAAVLSDAIAATMGRLPATTVTGLPLGSIKSWAATGPTPPGLLSVLVDDMVSFGLYDIQGFLTLPAAAQDDVRRRLFRSGLAASLDHTLRLLYSAADSNQAGAVALAGKVIWGTRMMLKVKMLRLLPSWKAPSGGTADRISLLEASACSNGGSSSGGSSSCGDTSGGGSDGGSSSSSGGGSSGGGSIRGTVAEGSEPSDPLGLLLTLSKRATMLTQALEVVSAFKSAGGGAQQQGQALLQLLTLAGNTLALLQVAGRSVQEDLGSRIGEAQEAAGTTAGVGTADAACQAAGTVCLDEPHEALALAARAACNLAATLAWQLAADPLPESNLGYLDIVGHAVGELLLDMKSWCSHPPALPTAQLLACQPHRLLAGACALAAALPVQCDAKQPLSVAIGCLVDALSSHQTLGCRVRSWLAPPPAAAGGGATSSEAAGIAEGDTCAGCLAGPLQSVPRTAAGAGEPGAGGSGTMGDAEGYDQHSAAEMVQQMLKVMGDSVISEAGEQLRPFGPLAAALLGKEGSANGAGARRPQGPPPSIGQCVALFEDMAAGILGSLLASEGKVPVQSISPLAAALLKQEGNPDGPGLRPLPSENSAAVAMEKVLKAMGSLSASEDQGPAGSPAAAPLREDSKADGPGLPPPQPPSGPPAPLPPPLVLPPSRAAALPRLYMCGNPRCGNFDGDCEAALPLKQCAGCRAVRYCGADCQRAHWREGHRAECKVLAAAGAK